jgi:hypothetical protein
MALNTFSALKSAIADWLNRADLTSQIPDFITMAEARFNREIRSDNMDVSETLTITSGSATVPTGLLSVRSIKLTADPYGTLKYQPPGVIEDADPEDTGAPGFYTRVGSSFIFWPPTSAAARIRYRKAITPLSDSATSNWLLAAHPDLYLAAPLALAYGLIKDEQRFQLWESAATGLIAQINKDDLMQREDGMQMQPGNVVV